jgi:hypothetical protein
MRKRDFRWPPAATHRCSRLLIAVALSLAGGWPGQAVWAQPAPADEDVLKAAFVYNFAKYTDWPDDLWNKSAKLRVCAGGERGGFSQAVAALESKPPIRGKAIEARLLSRPEDAAGCHILVIAGRTRMADWTRGVRLAPVLTVGDGEGFAAGAGLIGLYAEGEKLKFEINQEAAQRAGLKLSSQLLKLARLVKDEQAGGR